jgi:mono/diheme cytochrome c family protein
MRVFTLCSIVTVLLLSTLPSYSADPQHGLVLAKRWCATCHVVSADQQRASVDVPPSQRSLDPQTLIQGNWRIFY